MIGVRHEKGLRALALFEATKGGIVLVVGLGLLGLLHKDAQDLAETLVSLLRLNPASRYPKIFIEAAAKVDDARLWLLAGCAFLYSIFRFVEAYGLWRTRKWAEWVALISGGMYLPLEFYELAKGLTTVRLSAVIINIGIVVYLIWVIQSQRLKRVPIPS